MTYFLFSSHDVTKHSISFLFLNFFSMHCMTFRAVVKLATSPRQISAFFCLSEMVRWIVRCVSSYSRSQFLCFRTKKCLMLLMLLPPLSGPTTASLSLLQQKKKNINRGMMMMMMMSGNLRELKALKLPIIGVCSKEEGKEKPF
jgi:hypothetical protein